MEWKKCFMALIIVSVSLAMSFSAPSAEIKGEKELPVEETKKDAPEAKPEIVKSVGDPIVNFSLPDIDGNKHDLMSLQGEKATLLVYLQSACLTCRAEAKDIANMMKDGKDGVSVVFVIVDIAGPERAKSVLIDPYELEKAGTVLYDPEFSSGRKYLVFSTPSTLILKDGKLLKRFDGYNPNSKDAVMFVSGL